MTCAATGVDKVHCAADTSRGVVLLKTTGTGECMLGRTWGYDEEGIWVSYGCAGEFGLMKAAPPDAPTQPPPPQEPTPRIEEWGVFDPGKGFLVGRGDAGELAISAYALVRFINQMPGHDTFTDHLGNQHSVAGRRDIYPHRVIVYFKGWLGRPQLVYNIALWTVNTTDQDAIFGNIGYQFSKRFTIYGGINGNPGTRSMQGSHPFWLGHDRVMADEFFRPFFASGVWAQGEVTPGLWYNLMLGNSNSALGIKATQLDRRFASGASAWWMPTTHEFGPKGAYGDWESHDEVATRFGFSTTQSREQRYTNPDNGTSGNSTLRLADSINIFDTGALAPGVTVDEANFRVVSIDAGVKYKGLFLQTEIYTRWIDDFVADGPVPMTSIVDRGFYVQGAFFPIPKRLEVYGVTSQIYGDKDAGFGDSSEYGGGFNFYPMDTRNHRFNVQVLSVERSPVSSTFGYYVGGQTGTTIAAAFSVFF
ncbi:MAG: DUF3011 domain-containing protein [Vicinamibacterales bacterium]